MTNVHSRESRYRGRRGLRPLPIGKKCNPLCPFFRCSQRALLVQQRVFKGKPQRVAFCRWVGDYCNGAQCQFAYCDRRALLPDGSCLLAMKSEEIEKNKEKEEIFKEMEKEEVEDRVLKDLAKRYGRKKFDLEI